MALSALGKFAENIQGRILDGWIDLDGVRIDDEAVAYDGNLVVSVSGDKQAQIDANASFGVDTDGDGTVNETLTISSVAYDGGADQTDVTLASARSGDPTGNRVRYTGTTWQPLGHLQDVTINYSAVTQDADVAGRQKQIGMDVEASAVMQQTTAEEFSAVSGLTNPQGIGHTIKFVDRLTEQADVSTADGFEFVGILPSFDGEFDGSGEGSMFTISFNGRVFLAQFDGYDGTLKFDA